MRVLITAGPTVEDIDDVRFISNRSSGRMGYALAARCVENGWDVVLVSGPVCLEPPEGVGEVVRVRNTAEMAEAVFSRFESVDAVLMAAAVADYRPADRRQGKIKKSERLTLDLAPTIDILAALGERKSCRVLVGFALEAGGPDDPEARSEALRKAASKGLDAVVLNGPSNIGSETGRILALSPQGDILSDAEGTKDTVAEAITEVLNRLYREKHP